ncbi:MAG TPA: Rieske (2Fe-2S) protein [Ktedonobacterales bacterium]
MTTDDQRPPQTSGPLDQDGTPRETQTESVERYVRAHDIIERMRADLRPDRASATDDDPRLDLTAALLRAATPHAADVDPGFAERLFARLETAQANGPEVLRGAPTTSQPAAKTAKTVGPPRRRAVSRRGLVLGGLTAAAAAVIGGAAGAALEATTHSSPTALATPHSIPLVPDGVGAWVAVAREMDLPLGSVIRFQTDAVIGYLRHTEAGFTALSGVCTHMACLLQWNGLDRTFDCPCHGSRFLESGKQAPGAPYAYPSLPAIQTRVDQGYVWVYVISRSGSTTDPNGAPSPTPGNRYGA